MKTEEADYFVDSILAKQKVPNIVQVTFDYLICRNSLI